jgi:hypothetical protein
MKVKSIIPWKKDGESLSRRQGDGDPFAQLQLRMSDKGRRRRQPVCRNELKSAARFGITSLKLKNHRFKVSDL